MKTEINPCDNDVPLRITPAFLRQLVVLLLYLALLLTAFWLASAQVALRPETAYRADRILIKPTAGAELAALHQTAGVQVLRTHVGIGNLQVLQLPVGTTVAAAIAIYQNSGLVEYAEPDFLVHALATPNDHHYGFGRLWGLHNTALLGGKPDADIDAPEAWDMAHDAGGVIVAVVDTGVRATHEDLAANMWINPGESGRDILGRDKRFNGIDDDRNGYIDDVNGINAILGVGPPVDDHGHGTHVAGTIGAVGGNAIGIVGVAWRVQLMACKLLNAMGEGSVSDAIECIDYARRKGAKVINASWGWYHFSSTAVRDAIRSAGDAGIIFVAAAGNDAIDNNTQPMYPASYDLNNIIAVAATTRFDEIANWSNYGATTVDLAAPGQEILSCWGASDLTYQYRNGTSMAAPHVAGACALLWARYPSASHGQIVHRVLSTTDPLPSLAGKSVSGGRLNLHSALSSANVPPGNTGGGSSPGSSLPGLGPITAADVGDEPVITLSEFDPQASETGPDPGVVRFHRSGDLSQPIQVSWTFSGTAANGSDFNQLPTTSQFPAGLAQADLAIRPIDDPDVEGSENVIVTLVDGPGYSVGSVSNATVTIADNDQPPPPDPVITLSQFDPDASETGPDPGVVRFHRSGDLSQPIQVSWTFSGTAANGSDFNQLPTTSQFPAGLAQADLAIRPIDDADVEGSENVIVTLLDGPGYTVGSSSDATVNIADNDQPPPPEPIITLSQFDPDASETGPDPGVVRFHRSGDLSQPIQVSWSFSGTAANGSDFNQLPTTSEFPAGLAQADLAITPINDAEVESSESVTVTLLDGPGYSVGSSSDATVTIADNDQPPSAPTVTVTASDPDASEGGDAGTFTISRTGSTASPLTVSYTTSDAAENGIDYESLPGAVTIRSGAESVTVTVTPIDDTSIEGNETVVLALQANDAYTVGLPGSATLIIADNDESVVTLSEVDTQAWETGPNSGTIRFHRTGDPSQPIEVRWTFSGTAGNGSDFNQLPTSSPFPPSSQADLTVTPIDDAEVEGNETVVVTLIDGPGYTVGSPSSATITIADNDGPPPPAEPVITLSELDPEAFETGPNVGVIRFHRSGDTSQIIQVNWTLSGTAANGSDFRQLPTTSSFPPAAEADLTVTPIDDAEIETDETVILTLVDGPGYSVGFPNTATVTIGDDDRAPSTPTVTVTTSDPDASEGGDAGTFTISRTGSTVSSLTVNYTTSDTAQNGTDYESLTGVVTIPAGTSSATVAVTPIDDTVVEGNEAVLLTLAANDAYTVGSPDSATVSIADNDQPPPPEEPVITLSEFDPEALETGPNPGVIRFHRTGDTSQVIEVRWTFTGTAGNGSDFRQLPASSVFPASAAADLTITPIDDTEVEGNETVIVTLVDGPGYNVGSPSSATVTIADNDQPPPPPPPPTVTVAASDAEASESGDTGTFTISRAGSTASPLTVYYTMSETAQNGADYESLSGEVIIPAEAVSATVTVAPIDDTAAEDNETALLNLSVNDAYTVGSPSSASVIIADNDEPPPPPPTVTAIAADAEASENGDPGAFTISRTGSTASPLTVNYTTSDTAQNGTDYQSLLGAVTISAGASSATVIVTPIDDTAVEGSEAVVLTLGPRDAYTLGTPHGAKVIIADNDQPPPLPAITITATDASAAEPGNTGTFTISRSGSTASSLIVNYTISGTAQNGADYQSLSGSVTIAAGSSSANVAINPVDDSVVEGNETVVVTISTASGYTVGSPNNATVTIADNDQPPPPPPPTVSVVASDALGSEAGPDNGAFRISRSGSTAVALLVRLTLAGTARNGGDYQTLATSVTIPAGAASATVTVRPINDSLIELAESVILTLSSDPAYDIDLLLNAATVIINDNDAL
jgi:subtilisin family serine protease